MILTPVVVDLLMALLQERFPGFERTVIGVPVEDGQPVRDLMRRARIDDKDVMEAARRTWSGWRRSSMPC